MELNCLPYNPKPFSKYINLVISLIEKLACHQDWEIREEVKEKGFLEKFPKPQRSWEGVKKKLDFATQGN